MKTKTMDNLSVEYFLNGFSCSESIIKAGVELGFCDESLIDVATSFSGGMGGGCLCGAISGAQMIIGNEHGRGKTGLARQKAAKLVHEFQKEHKATCCRVLTKGLEFGSPERKNHCKSMVQTAAKILEEIL